MSTYWERRAARDMYERMETAEEAAERIRKLYVEASKYLSEEALKIFEKFVREQMLTEREARALLNIVQNPRSFKGILARISLNLTAERREKLKSWLESADFRIDKLANVQAQIDEILSVLYDKTKGEMDGAFSDIIKDTWLHTNFNLQKRVGVGLKTPTLSKEDVEKLLSVQWNGKNYSERLWGNTEELSEALKEELSLGFLTGKTEHEMAQAIEARFGKGYNAARRLVRTEACYLSNQIQLETYKRTGVTKYIYVAVLDLRTSEICRELDGKTFNVEAAEPGVNFPPMHPWCRSTTIAWLPDRIRATMKRRAYDPATGRTMTIPANMTYKEWYEKYVEGAEPSVTKEYADRNLTREQYERYVNRGVFDGTYEDFIKMKSDKEAWAKYKDKYKEAGKVPPKKSTSTNIGNAQNVIASMPKAETESKVAIDVTNEYIENANPAPGEITFEEGKRNPRGIEDDIHVGNWLKNTFGGDVVLLAEKDIGDNPDFNWNGKLWDLKTPTSIKYDTIKKRLRKGLEQINENPGGIVFDTSKNGLTDEDAQRMVDTFMRDYSGYSLDIMLINGDRLISVKRNKK